MTAIIDDTLRHLTMSEPASTPDSHPEAVTRPYWQTRPCPPWCDTVHQDGDFVADRHHYTAPGMPIDLSLYDAKFGEGEWGPGELRVSIDQHYRQGEPTVGLLVPQHALGDDRVTGELDLDLTVNETRALRDRLSLILRMLEEPTPTPVLAAVDELGGVLERSVETTIAIGHNHAGVAISAELIRWAREEGGSDVEVCINATPNSWGYTPDGAREVAAQLRHAADVIDAYAAQAKMYAADGGAQ